MNMISRITLDLPREAKTKIKLAATKRNQTMAELLRELVHQFLLKEEKREGRGK